MINHIFLLNSYWLGGLPRMENWLGGLPRMEMAPNGQRNN